MSTEFYADYIKKTTFDPDTSSVRQKFTAVKADDVTIEIDVKEEEEQLQEAATDVKKKPASKTPKVEVPATEIPEELHGDQDKLDHNKDKKISASDMKKVRKHGPVDTDEGFLDSVKGAVSSVGNAVSGSISARKAKFGTSGGAKSASSMRSVNQSTEYDNGDGIMEGTFKVDVEGLPTMYIDGSSAGTIKAQMRKKFKDPKAVVNVERITSTEKKQELRAKMSEEDLNELDKKTMGSYVKKAVNDLDNRSFTQGMRDNNPKYTSADAKNNAKIRARRTGIDRAVNKMSEDQAAIDAYLKKGGKITKVPPAKAQGAHGDTSMASGVAGQLSKADTSRFKTQKKVKSMEDVEQFDEISSELASRAHSSARKQVDYKKTTPTTAKKSDQGTKALAYHQRKAVNPSHTGTSYKGSPGGTDVAAAYKSSSEPARKTSGKYIDKLKKQGIDVSEEQVDEISKRAKAAYTRVAARDVGYQSQKSANLVANNDHTDKNREAIRAADRKRNNRLQGIDRATKGLQKEGAMKRIATDAEEKRRLKLYNRPNSDKYYKQTGLDTYKKKPSTNEEKDTHVTKDGRTAKKGLWYNIHKKRARGEAPAKPGDPDRPSAADLKRSQ